MVKRTVCPSYAGDPCPDEVYVIPLALARLLRAYFEGIGEFGVGDYWRRVLGRPLYHAIRGKQDTVSVTTAGFSAQHLVNAIGAVGGRVAW